jgi:glycosyltransferase involved in cell wall biosynthesis
MQVSVVICVHTEDRYDDFCAAVESVLGQTHEAVEVVAVVDGNNAVCARVREEYGDSPDVRIHCNETNRGLSYSRTRGVEQASGEVIAFLDDDAVAHADWVEQLCRGYEEGALAVGGRMVPEWVGGRPDHLPEEFSWLVGVTYEPRLADWTEVRNTMGSNISFRREVFEELGGFDEQVGLAGDANLQAEETEFCIRMGQTFGRGVLYNPEAVVAHRVFAYRTGVPWLLRRAFWQGYSKRAVETLGSDRGDAERDFLRHLACAAVPRRLRGLAADPSIAAVQQLLMLVALTAAVGVGYLYAFRRW